MWTELFHDSPLLLLPIIALGLFATAFAAAVAAVFMRSSSDYRRMAELPLEDQGHADP